MTRWLVKEFYGNVPVATLVSKKSHGVISIYPNLYIYTITFNDIHYRLGKHGQLTGKHS